MDEKFKNEAEAVKKLGEEIGYGNLIAIAAAIWRASLKKQGIVVEEITASKEELDRYEEMISVILEK